MNAAIVLGAAGIVTWLLRVAFVGLVPASALPLRVRRALDVTAPSAMAALIAKGLVSEGASGQAIPALAATAVCVFVMWRVHNLAAVAIAGVATYWVIGLL